ncbi:hypothetical protein [Sorangium sp. So ce176]|uniref:hypothetical protein n=1 Tax=Sorangium sp. So ce176 TaxID=3133286 RepID=UPI003F5EEEBF
MFATWSRRKMRCGIRSEELVPRFIGQRGSIILKIGNAVNVQTSASILWISLVEMEMAIWSWSPAQSNWRCLPSGSGVRQWVPELGEARAARDVVSLHGNRQPPREDVEIVDAAGERVLERYARCFAPRRAATSRSAGARPSRWEEAPGAPRRIIEATFHPP